MPLACKSFQTMVHIWHRKKKHAALLQQPMSGGKPDFREGHMLQHIGHADDAITSLVIEFFDRLAIAFISQSFQGADILFAQIKPARCIAPFLCSKQKRAVAEADIEPASPGCITRNARDDSR